MDLFLNQKAINLVNLDKLGTDGLVFNLFPCRNLLLIGRMEVLIVVKISYLCQTKRYFKRLSKN